MKKFLNKVLLVGACTLFSSSLFAQETICYKNGVTSPSEIETTPLNGVVCHNQLSVNDMKKDGWSILDIQVATVDGKLNYSYYFYKTDGLKNAPQISSANKQVAFSTRPIGTKITNLESNKSTIDIGNLIVGQSGIVVHIYDNDKRSIVANAKVISSNENSSVVEFFSFDDLKQEALPTTNRGVALNDVLVLNYMYNSSLLITPNFDTFQAVRSEFNENNFIHSDIFAAKLKYNNRPYPTKDDIQEFAIEQNLGTVFFVLDGKIYVVDAKTFTILDSYKFTFDQKEQQIPFYTRVEDIESPFYQISFIWGNENLSYNDYYKNILGLKR
ncbi:plasminogen-binding N-terminal domain-containing protein [Arcobacter vandammei]|uniref:plasminogen-binding N-terminal domain-containing protein n=1 Tax=Arcobacter vandammei TaxID=2782243 RepID=UPI0018DF4668|nr:plasminogen-binding N-terminal domain-containing protein [Arcobacter vandammei]